MCAFAARAGKRGAFLALVLMLAGCQGTGAHPVDGDEAGLAYPLDVDPAKVHLALAEIPDAPDMPPAADLANIPPMPQPALRRFTDAKAMFDDQRYAEAALELENALRYDQKQVEVKRLLCLAYYLSGNAARGRLRAREVLEIDPRDVAARFVLGRSALNNGQPEEALRHFRIALQCPPDLAAVEYNALVHLHAGLLLDDLGYARAAVDELDAFEVAFSALDEKQRAHPALEAVMKTSGRTLQLRRGRALAKMGDFQAAAAAFAEPAANAPDDLDLQTEYAKVLVRAGRADAAVDLVKAFVARQAASRESVELLLSVRQWTGQAVRAVDDLQGLVAQYPDRMDLALMLARLLQESNRMDAAADVLRTVQKRHPEEMEPAWLLAEMQGQQGQWQAWMTTMADCVEAREDQYARVRRTVGTLEIDSDRTRAALADGVRAAESQADRPSVLFVAGLVAQKLGEPETAERLYRKSVSRSPAGVAANLALGELLAEQYRWTDVVTVGEQAIAAGAHSHAMEWLVGFGYDGLDNHAEAVKRYQAALAINNKDLRSLRSLGLLYERLGRVKDAQAQFAAILAIDAYNAEAREKLIRALIAMGGVGEAESQLVELRDRHGAGTPIVRRCQAVVQLVRTGDRKAFFDELAAILADHPQDVETHELYASSLLDGRRHDEAAAATTLLLQLAPESMAGLELRALLAVRALDDEASVRGFRELLKRNPNRVRWQGSLARVYLFQLRYDEAAAIWQALIDAATDPITRNAYRAGLLRVYRSAGRIDTMRELAESWLAQTPDEPVLRSLVLAADEAAENHARIVERCQAWLRTGDAAAARQWQMQLLLALQALERFDEADVQLLDWLDETPDDISHVTLIANELSARGRHDDAIEWVRNAMAAATSDATIGFLELLSRIQFQAKDYDGAIASKKEMIRQRPDVGFEPEVAQVLIQAGRYDDATDFLHRLIEQEQSEFKKAALLRLLSWGFQRQGRVALAEQRLRDALELAPDDIGVNNDLGYTLADNGKDLAEAEVMLRFAVGENVRDAVAGRAEFEAAYLDSLGWVYYKKGDMEAALTWLRRGATLPGGRDPVIHDHLGDTYWRLAQPDAARQEWVSSIKAAAERAAEGLGDTDADTVAKVQAKLDALARGDTPVVAPIGGEPVPESQPAGNRQE
ncbi:MAG: tetratricopeptide repeat protein [Phycisphaerae bacterium]|nr:tetratricopeptide repeat protein [Phycisphaerae bacterium]